MRIARQANAASTSSCRIDDARMYQPVHDLHQMTVRNVLRRSYLRDLRAFPASRGEVDEQAECIVGVTGELHDASYVTPYALPI